MSDTKKDQIGQWLKKLEQESWQLELLVSAFTIFLLIQATDVFSVFLSDLPYHFNLNDGILTVIYVFLGLMGMALKALSFFLIIHLMLRGFWIGTIGLRSVQSNIDFEQLHYSELFTKKLNKRVISLDEMVIMLDEICSVIFSFSFLVISMLLSFGLYLLFFGFMALSLSYMNDIAVGWLNDSLSVLSALFFLLLLVTGLMYMIDYFSLGFFKKYKWLSRVYYPIYRLYSLITLSVISRSIYYYLISKFSKKRIRLLYLVFGFLFFLSNIVEYDQHQYFSDESDEVTFNDDYYDNLRPSDKSIDRVSIPSNFIHGSFMQLFLRYDPRDNVMIKSHCQEFEPMKEEGLNMKMKFNFSAKGMTVNSKEYKGDYEKLLDCQSAIYKVYINDSLYAGNKYYFFVHPVKEQKGLMTMLSTDDFVKGENILNIKKSTLDNDGKETLEDYVYFPFWFEK